MIICKNCGAEYDDEQDRCPYCGGDNFGKSVQVHEDMMNELEREKKTVEGNAGKSGWQRNVVDGKAWDSSSDNGCSDLYHCIYCFQYFP